MIPYYPLNEITAGFEPKLSEAIARVVASGWYLHGSEVEAFESEFSAYTGCAHCVGVGNGLDALTLSLMVMKKEWGWDEQSEVIVPDMTFIATAEAVVRAGLVPVLADVGSDALLTPETAEQVLSSKTRAVIPVHLYGHPAPMRVLTAWAKAHNLCVLEDAAQAHGACIDGKPVGSWGDMAAFSFYPGKNLGALGDGGAVTTQNKILAHGVRVLANYGAERKYYHTELGLNSRLDELQAAVLRVKLARLDADNKHRRRIAALYAAHIHHSQVVIPYEGLTDGSVFHIYPLRCSQRDALQRHLTECGVQTLIHYPLPLSDQPAIAQSVMPTNVHTPCAKVWAQTELSLPISAILSDRDALSVCAAVNSFVP